MVKIGEGVEGRRSGEGMEDLGYIGEGVEP